MSSHASDIHLIKYNNISFIDKMMYKCNSRRCKMIYANLDKGKR